MQFIRFDSLTVVLNQLRVKKSVMYLFAFILDDYDNSNNCVGQYMTFLFDHDQSITDPIA